MESYAAGNKQTEINIKVDENTIEQYKYQEINTERSGNKGVEITQQIQNK